MGQITVVVDPPKGTACYIMNVSGLDGITAAHIHTGGPGKTGGPVVMLDTPAEGTSGGCRRSPPTSPPRCWPIPAATTSTSTPAPCRPARSAGS